MSIFIDDRAQVAEAPTFLLVAESHRYRDDEALDRFGGFVLHVAPCPQGQSRIEMFSPTPIISFNSPPSRFLEYATHVFKRARWERGERLGRYERRQRARALGRRRAVPVPLEVRYEVACFTSGDVPPEVAKTLLWRRLVVVERTWRRGDALQWARRRMKQKRRVK